MRRSQYTVCLLALMSNMHWLTTQVLANASPVGTRIENATCELIRAGAYRIDYHAAPDAGVVEVFVSSYPDCLDSAKPVLRIRRTPMDIVVHGRSAEFTFI